MVGNYRLQDIQLRKSHDCRPSSPLTRLRRATVAVRTWLANRRPPPRGRARQPKPASASAPAGEAGGEYRARTGDLLVANQALSQLS